MTTRSVGYLTEARAKQYLLDLGYTFVAQNFSVRGGEIDLIFLDLNQLVFVEVKARTSAEQGSPLEAITPTKLRHLQHTAQSFMHAHPQLPQWGRFDAVAIDLSTNTLEHIKNISL